MSMVSFEKHRESVASASTVDSLPTATCQKPLKAEQDDVLETVTDGGAKAWLTVFGASLALYCSFGQLNAFGTFQTWYADHQLQTMSASTISWIGSLQLWVFFVSGGAIGRLFDEYGPRPLMTSGTVILTLSLMITSICYEYYQYILCQGILFGLGVGLMFYPSLAAIATHFRRYRATAVGIAMAGSGIGGVVYPIMYRHLFIKVGFGWAVRISGFMCLAMCITAVGTVSSRLPGRRPERPWLDLHTFRDRRFTLVVIASIFISFGLFIPNFYIVDYATSHGISAAMAFYVLAIMNAGSIPGRLAPPFVSDALGRFNLLVPCVFLAGFSCLVFWIFAKNLAAIIVFSALFGFFSGGFNALIVSCVAQISAVEEIGTRVGTLYTIISFPALGGGPAAGALLQYDRASYSGLIALSGAAILAGSIFMLLARLAIDSRLSARV